MKKGGYGSYTIKIYANTYQNSDEIKAHRKIYFTKTDMRRYRKKHDPNITIRELNL